MTSTDPWWQLLITQLETLGEVMEQPGRLVLTVDGRRLEIVLTEGDWDDLVSISFGVLATATSHTLDVVTLTLQHDLPFLVYANYMLYPSSTPELAYGIEVKAKQILKLRRPDGDPAT